MINKFIIVNTFLLYCNRIKYTNYNCCKVIIVWIIRPKVKAINQPIMDKMIWVLKILNKQDGLCYESKVLCFKDCCFQNLNHSKIFLCLIVIIQKCGNLIVTLKQVDLSRHVGRGNFTQTTEINSKSINGQANSSSTNLHNYQVTAFWNLSINGIRQQFNYNLIFELKNRPMRPKPNVRVKLGRIENGKHAFSNSTTDGSPPRYSK